jgi:hypothetical protein
MIAMSREKVARDIAIAFVVIHPPVQVGRGRRLPGEADNERRRAAALIVEHFERRGVCWFRPVRASGMSLLTRILRQPFLPIHRPPFQSPRVMHPTIEPTAALHRRMPETLDRKRQFEQSAALRALRIPVTLCSDQFQ